MITAMFAIGVTLTATGLTALAGLVVAIIRDPGRPTVPGWRPGELTALATEPGWMRPACPICSGRHCAGCEAPAQHMSTSVGHQPAHSELEIPPSIAIPALMLDPVRRARELTRQLANRAWRPTTPPAVRVRRVQLELAARLRAAGVPCRLSGPAAGRLA